VTRGRKLVALLVAGALVGAGCGGSDGKSGSSGSGGGNGERGNVFGGGGDCKGADDALRKAARDHVAGVDADSITVDVCRKDDEDALATVTVNGLRDDSVRDVRHELRLIKVGGLWQVTDDQDSRRCQKGRGHQEFSGEICQ
jgi:hypothetical protein